MQVGRGGARHMTSRWPAAVLLALLCCRAHAVPAWSRFHKATRHMLNPQHGKRLPTDVCHGQFNTPCAIEMIHLIVYDLAAAFEEATDLAAFQELVSSVNAKRYNMPVLFWPTVLNASGHVLATGTEASASYEGPPYVGGFFQDILLYEARHATPDSGGVFQDSVWEDLQAHCQPTARIAKARA